MFLYKDGVTIEAIHQADILHLKRAGYKEVVPEVVEEKPQKVSKLPKKADE